MASAFAQGFQMGGDMFDATERNRLMRERLDIEKAQDARAAEQHGLAMKEGGLRLGGLQRVDEATRALTDLQTRGVALPDTEESFNAAVEATGRGLPMPAQPYRPATERELNMSQMGLAAAKGDMGALATLQAARRTMDIGDVASRVMKMPVADLEKEAPDITRSGYPLLYTGKDPKTGYTFLKTEADGKTPIPGSQFSLNESQLRQMKLAHELGLAGFGSEAMTTLSAAHKDVGDHVAKWNDVISKSATGNNTAKHYANTDENGRITANAAATNAASTKSLRDLQVKEINDRLENKAEALALLDKWNALTPEQQNGPEGDALNRQYNMINVKAGGIVPMQGKGKGSGRGVLAMPVEQKKNDDGTYTAFAKDGGQALYNTINGEAIPLGMDAPTYAAHKKAAQESGVKLVVGENNGRLELKYQGADGKFYDDAKQARYAKSGASAPAQQPGGLRAPTGGTPTSIPGDITVSINPQTKAKTFVVQGLRQRFNTLEDAQAAARTVPGQSGMSASLNRYGD